MPTLTLKSSGFGKAVLVIGADGVKSLTRECVVGGPDKPAPTGDATYRAIIPTDLLLNDPDLRPLVETPQMVCSRRDCVCSSEAPEQSAPVPRCLFTPFEFTITLAVKSQDTVNLPISFNSTVRQPIA